MAETIVCIAPEFALILARSLALRLFNQCGDLPLWFVPKMSLKDWWKGYRKLFPSKQHAGLAVTVVKDPKSGRMLYSQLKGLPFGLGLSVNQFSRAAAIQTAVDRRIFLWLAGKYMGDKVLLEMFHVSSGQSLGDAVPRASAESSGIVYSDSKHRPPFHAGTIPLPFT